ncbi:TraM recognition domain-containing protein [Vallitalea guaymasensis]|uniref:TraM recognition domain-containing protein n=1 Tax=Vallitalea guaymasensis TaxID=1185412 RepID=UPI000DE3AC89|nr:TraM recognition domain-containing protein [Vallitalea guaymasensis]
MSDDQKRTDQELFEERLKKRKDSVLNYVEDTTGLKHNNDTNTIIVNDYKMDEDNNMSYTIQAIKKTRHILLSHLFEFLIFTYYAVFLVENIAYIIQFHDSFITLDLSIFPQNKYVFAFWFISPIIVWFLSTNTTFWNYHLIKRSSLIAIIVFLSFRFSTFVYMLSYKFFIPFVARARVSESFTINKILGLGYILLALPTLITFIIVLNIYSPVYKDTILKEIINNFRLFYYVTLPKFTYYSYTMPIVRDMKTGFKKVIEEHDRWLHSITIGATGAAKTSSCLLPAIYRDFIVKFRNVKRLKKLFRKHVKKGHFYFTQKFNDADFSINYIKPHKGYEKKYNKIIKKYKSAGITAMAPDDSLTDKVFEMSKAFGFKCNRIDPKLTEDGKLKEGFIGINPLFISPSIPEWARTQEMVKRATLFADVMQVLNELSGTKSDPYFASINRIGTTTISMLLMLTYTQLHNGEQPTPDNVLDLLNDFERILPYFEKLEEIDIKNEYQTIKDVIQQDFLGPGKDTFWQHSRGLRVQLNNFFTNRLIRNVLCTQNSVDIDKTLANGEVTVCNIELGELGPTDSPAFGLFYSVSFINAVLRRPGDEWSRLPHFCYIDEFPVIVSPAFESCFSLFRKFKVSMNVALQTLDQLKKSPFTQYLKGVLMNNCGHHIVFGRANLTEMKEYSELAGKELKTVVQVGSTETHITEENPSISFNERETPSLENKLDPHEVRKKPFQEVTFTTTKRGTLQDPIHGRVFFLPRYALNKKKPFIVNWEGLYDSTNNKDISSSNDKNNDNPAPAKTERNIRLSEIMRKRSSEVATTVVKDGTTTHKQETIKITKVPAQTSKIATVEIKKTKENVETNTPEPLPIMDTVEQEPMYFDNNSDDNVKQKQTINLFDEFDELDEFDEM